MIYTPPFDKQQKIENVDKKLQKTAKAKAPKGKATKGKAAKSSRNKNDFPKYPLSDSIILVSLHCCISDIYA